MDRSETRATRGSLLVLGALLAAWLWPLGIGGAMPIGGDATRFAIGLMDFLHRSYRAGRLPLWNDLWGYGFPGLAESQMGVYYPPHLVLYGLLPTEFAYTSSLVAHTFWGGLGAFWAARRFGARPVGAALGGFAWAASGFFVIHLPHPWGYTVGSWMPWAWGLAWPLAAGTGMTRDALRLAAVLTLQVLPGHFQLAFITQVGVLGLALWGLIEHSGGWRRGIIGAVRPLAAVGAVAPLGAMQLIPTWELARQASSRRGFEYLSGFAATPLHLVSYLAPGLFHGSPLWRPLAWDPFHTSPEEHLAYIGLAPLFLALCALRHGWRRDRGVRALGWLAVGSLVLSLGPYVPGFRLLIALPGFSLFRAPARWGLATELALALLAAKGFGLLRRGTPPRLGLAGFVAGSVLLVVLAVAPFEAVMGAMAGPGAPGGVVYDRARTWLPWEAPPWRRLAAELARPPRNPLILDALARQGRDPARARLDRERWSIYGRELGGTGLMLGLMLGIGIGCRRRPAFASGLAVLTALELLAHGHALRAVEAAPLRAVTSQSPVLARLAAESRGTRVLSSLRNWPMAFGVAALPPYRTLDRPALEALTSLADAPPSSVPGESRRVWEAGRAVGAGVRVFEPGTVPEAVLANGPGRMERIEDATLAGWLRGPSAVRTRGATFLLWRPVEPPARAWFLAAPGPLAARAILLAPGEPSAVLRLLRRARPLPWRTLAPEHVCVALDTDGPGVVILSQLDDPGWRAALRGQGGVRPAAIRRVFAAGGPEQGGWQGVRVPGPGHWTLELLYQGGAARRGQALSAVAWGAWLVAYWSLVPGFGRHAMATRDKGPRVRDKGQDG